MEILDNDPAFHALSDEAKLYFDFDKYGEFLDDNATFLKTKHKIWRNTDSLRFPKRRDSLCQMIWRFIL